MVPSNSFLVKKIHPFTWMAGASLCVAVLIPDVHRVASGVKHNMINFVTTNILGAPQQPHDVIHLGNISIKINKESGLFLNKSNTSFALQGKCSAFAIAKTKDAVVVLSTAHCPPTGNQVRTANGQRLGPVEKVFLSTSSEDLSLAVISAAPEVLSTITTIPVATPEESRGILSQTTQYRMNVMAVGYPQMNPFVSEVQMNRTLGGDRYPVAIVAPLVRVGESKNFFLDVGLLGSAAGFSGGALVGSSGNNPRIVGVITNQIRGETINGNRVINEQFLLTDTFPTTETEICVQDNGGQNASLSLEKVIEGIASLSPCGAR